MLDLLLDLGKELAEKEERRAKTGGYTVENNGREGVLPAPGGHLPGREIIREIKEWFPEAGEVLEKGANMLDAAENVIDAATGGRGGCPIPGPVVDDGPIEFKMMDMMQDHGYSLREAKQKLHRGDHIYVYRLAYSHHGIYDGHGGVYHYSGEIFAPEEAMIQKTSLEEFADGTRIFRYDYQAVVSPDEIIARAESRLGEQDYDLIDNNCERFAKWCRGL